MPAFVDASLESMVCSFPAASAQAIVVILSGSVTPDGEPVSDYFRSANCCHEMRQARVLRTPAAWGLLSLASSRSIDVAVA